MGKKKKSYLEGATKKLVMTALMTAMVALATSMASFKAGHGYLHFGDGVIFAGVYLLGPYGAVAAALGSGMADFLAGFPAYIPATIVIKGLMALVALVFLRKAEDRPLPMLAGMALGELLMTGGYFGYEALLYGGEGALAGVLPNLLQGVFGVAVGMILVRAMRRLHR